MYVGRDQTPKRLVGAYGLDALSSATGWRGCNGERAAGSPCLEGAGV